VVFDVGETLFSEERLRSLWADWLKVPRDVFASALREVIERRAHHRAVFDVFAPGFDVESARLARVQAGWAPDLLEPGDIYADAIPCLAELAARGLRLGIAANQPSPIEEMIRALGLPFDFIATSETWGVEKPSPEFFARLMETCAEDPSAVAYVGDRVDNDVIPAASAGLVAVFLRRGPWGLVQANWPEISAARICVDSLTELPAALGVG
jgi:FMN phosphatase YigB (HAD superfamily)